MGLVPPELQYSGPFLSGYLEWEGHSLFLKETRKKLLLRSARVTLSERPMDQLVDVSQALEVVALSCGLQALAEGRNA